MKVLLVEFTSAVSGAERSMLELVRGLRPAHEVEVACPAGELAGRVAETGAAVHTIPASRLTFRLHPRHTTSGLLSAARAAHALRQVVRACRPAVVHANSIRAGLLAIPAARGIAPVVVHCRDAMPRGALGGIVRRFVSAGADELVAISCYVATSFAGAAWRGRGVRVIHNAVDLARFRPTATPCDDIVGLGPDPGLVVVAVVAQITPWKGQDLAIRTLDELRRRGRGAVLMIVGEAKFVAPQTTLDNRAYERELHHLVDELGLRPHVRFLGERADIERILAATDVLLVPSVEEPFGRTVIEAMAMCVPVVATSVGGPAEILSDGVGGRIVHGRAVRAWADAVEELAAWPPARRAEARPVAEARFSRARHVEAIVAVYAAAIERHRRR